MCGVLVSTGCTGKSLTANEVRLKYCWFNQACDTSIEQVLPP